MLQRLGIKPLDGRMHTLHPTDGLLEDDQAAAAFVDHYHQTHPRPPKLAALKWVYDHPRAIGAMQACVTGGGAAAATLGLSRVPMTGLVMSTAAWGVAGALWRWTAQSQRAAAAACTVAVAIPATVGALTDGAATGWLLGAGGAAVLAAACTYGAQRVIAAPGYDTGSYAYEEAAYAGARLYYKADAATGRKMPVLELNADDPQRAGIGHGFLLGREICTLWDNYHSWLWKMPNFSAHPKLLQQVSDLLAPQERCEIAGMALGFNQWAVLNRVNTRLAYEDLLGMNCLPDMCHLTLPQPPDVALGCTSIFCRDDDGALVFGRNMDWAAFGNSGGMSLVMVWKSSANRSFATLGVPGLLGAVTGWNSTGLNLAMNVVMGNTVEVAGIPIALFNRRILRDAANVAEVFGCIGDKPPSKPLGPYHLLVSDSTRAQCISVYQGEDGGHFMRELGTQRVMWTLNWTYPQHRDDAMNSPERDVRLRDYFSAAANLALFSADDAAVVVAGALQDSTTAGFITLQSVMFEGDRVILRTSNAFAPDKTPVTLDRKSVF